VCLFCAAGLRAQQTDSASSDAQPSAGSASSAKVPQLVRFSGVLRDLAGQPLTGSIDVHFAIYKDETDTAAIWEETQTLQLDEHGRYTVLLGATQPEGLPLLLFQSTEAQWLGVSAGKLPEQPHILLVSVPYALKASDADTLGGKPASAYVTTDAASNSSGQSPTPGTTSVQGQVATVGQRPEDAASNPSPTVAGTGTMNFLPIWTNSTTLGNSLLLQFDGNVGVATATPGARLDASGTGISVRGTSSGVNGTGVLGNATAGTGASFGVLGETASKTNSAAGVLGKANATTGVVYGVMGSTSSTTANASGVFGNAPATTGAVYGVLGNTSSATNNAAGVMGNDLATTGQVFGVLGTTASSTANAAGVSGLASAATGYTFGVGGSSSSTSGVGVLGAATATSGGGVGVQGFTASPSGVGGAFFNTSGSGLVLTGSSGSSFTQVFSVDASGNGSFAGSMTASSFSGVGSGLTSVNAAALNGLAASAFQRAGSYAVTTGPNTFAGAQTISTGDISISSGNLDLPATTGSSVGVITLGGAPFAHGFGGPSAYNTFLGYYAGNFSSSSINTGNTATGYQALYANAGQQNTANGSFALLANNTGSYNTAIGSYALATNTSGGENTASGTGALSNNSTGSSNTASGYDALWKTTGSSNSAIGMFAGYSNTSGTDNTFIGFSADAGSGALTNATAIGWNAKVSASNSLVLGGTGASAVNVGIGTATPAYTLDVQGTGNFTGAVNFGQPVTFASGQTFPGTGTVTSVASGAGLTGGPITSSGTLSIATGGVTNAMLQNSSLTVTAGSGLTGGGPVSLGGTTTLSLNSNISGSTATFAGSNTTQIVSATQGGSGTALVGTNTANGAYGQLGTNVSSLATGVSGSGFYGVYGSSATGGAGVWGSGSSNGVYGVNSTNGSYGELGMSLSGDATGVYGSGSVYGVYGSGGTIGVQGFAGTMGVLGLSSSASGTGVYGGSSGGPGVYGSGNAGPGLSGYNKSTTNATLVLTNSSGDKSGEMINAMAPIGTGSYGCILYNDGIWSCTELAILAVGANDRKVALYPVQSPENWFEDFGSGKLENGVATVALDPGFLETVNAGMDYHVFLTPGGDCKGLYVAEKTPASFQVRELGGGESSVGFDYRIVARRKGYETIRLADMTEKFRPVEIKRPEAPKMVPEPPKGATRPGAPAVAIPKPPELPEPPTPPRVATPPAGPTPATPRPWEQPKTGTAAAAPAPVTPSAVESPKVGTAPTATAAVTQKPVEPVKPPATAKPPQK
jgi:hypothetical protein